MEMHERLRKARADAGYSSAADAARALGVSVPTYLHHENGTRGINVDRAQQYARRFGVGLEWLLTGKSGPAPNAIPVDLPPRGDRAQIPVYGHAVGGVQGEFELNGNELFTIDAPPGYTVIKGCYAVQVSGDSMSPRYEDGEIVMVDPSQRVRRGDYVVAQIAQDEHKPPLAFVKRFVKHNSEELVLQSLNPPVPEDEPLSWNAETVQSVHKIVFSRVG